LEDLAYRAALTTRAADAPTRLGLGLYAVDVDSIMSSTMTTAGS
jgi:hypothetical protein